MAAIKAFREPGLVADIADGEAFADWGSRQTRYAVYWAFYENTAYRDIHTWARQYKVNYQLYRYIRNIYNPAYRIGEIWKGLLMGGILDPAAGDGEEIRSALPIQTPHANLRPAIAQLWEDSNWQVRKDLYTLWGSVLGDVALQVVDDAERQKVYLDVVYPGIIKSVTMDNYGNVKGYVYEYEAIDPEDSSGKRKVTYREECSRSGDAVVYQTYRNNAPYAWNGEAAEWTEPYGFVPLVVIKHNDIGLDWGWSELHAARAKIHELDDVASKLTDYIRKSVDAPWLLAGVSPPPKSTPTTSGRTPTTDRPEPEREEIPMLYGPAGAQPHPLIAPLSIADVNTHIGSILEELERDYPELQVDRRTAAGEISGVALRIARKPVEKKARARRAIYDNGLVRAQQMALAIGGHWGYPGYEGFSLDSYGRGELDHHIADRPVYETDPEDEAQIELAEWSAANSAKNFGIPIPVYLKRKGWSQQDIAEVTNSPEYQARLAQMQLDLEMRGENQE